MADEQYDLTTRQIRSIKERAAIRAKLKHEFRRQLENPHALKGDSGYIFDPAIQRFQSMRVTEFDHFKATPKTSFLGIVLFVLPVAALTYAIYKERTIFEGKCRRGEIKYKDRLFKFI